MGINEKYAKGKTADPGRIMMLPILTGVYYNNRQFPTVVCWVLDKLKCFDTPRKNLKTRGEAECF